MPEVTVITAAYIDTDDKRAWLEECGRSVLEQEGVDAAWIVVDDSSPLEPPRFEDPRVRVVQASRRQGPSACRNTAAALAESDAIIALDADDVLAGTDVLARLMDAWERRPDRFYYGNIQLINQGVPGKVIQFPQYNFMQTLDPKGLVPVTALLSKEAWFKAGGWKSELEHGLEDVEFWISVGKAGWCGYKQDLTTILYRRHPTSRTQSMRANGAIREREMRAMIREMHADLYEGRLPMGCCGGKNRGGPAGQPLPISQPAPRALPSDDLPGGKVWVRYNGTRSGEFSIRGQVTGTKYDIGGVSAEFEIHAQDAHFFRNLGRGKDFSVGIAAPAPEPEPEPVSVAVAQEYTPPPPVPAEIVAARPEPEPEVVMKAVEEPVEYNFGLEQLDVPGIPAGLLDEIKSMLEIEGWTVPQLASAATDELTPYPNVGTARAKALIEAAQSWNL